MIAAPTRRVLIMSADGARSITRVSLVKDVLSIGRDLENDVVLDDMAISRRHLSFTRHGDCWHVAVVSGAGALFVNGRQCDAAEVRDGDQIEIGGTVLRLEWSEEAPSPPEQATPVNGGSLEAAEQMPTVTVADPVPTITVDCHAGRFTVPLREAHLSIGRAMDCGLIIPSRVISAHQATLQRGPDGAYTLIPDERARNPFTANGSPIQSHLLRHGDTLLIGVRESGEYATLTYAAPYGAETPEAVSMEAPTLGDSGASIGRDPASTYSLPSPLVSWHHAQLRRDSAGTLVEDLGSTNGTFVNLTRLDGSRPHHLATGDLVQVGPYAFTFDGARLAPKVEAGPKAGLQVEAVNLVRTTHGGQTMLLDHVTLHVQPGQFVAIIGGNGAGKSTLLKALAGIQPAQHGSVLFGGVDSYHYYDLFRGRIGYVPQADIVHAALTVEEALYYTARLRLSRDLRDEEIEERIQLVLEAVDLSPHQSKLIGSLSGGEKKRLSLAVELLAEPQVLFLDEPNAALDPNHRRELLATVRSLANQGRTLIMVTHFREDFDACDRVAVMGRGGRLCFYGAPSEALRFFGVGAYEDIYTHIEESVPADAWRKRYQQLPRYQEDLRAHSGEHTLGGRRREAGARPGWQATGGAHQTSSVRQFNLLLDRYARILARDRVNLAILLLQAPVIGLILAAVSKVGAFTSASGPVDAEKILFLLAVVAIWFGTSNSVREISKEGDIYQRERLAGLRILPYILSKVGLLALLCVIQTLVLLIIVTARTGLPPASAGLFFSPLVELYIGMVLAGLAGLGLGLCVSAFASNPDKAVSAVPLVLLPQILLAGVIFQVSGPVQPLADVTISRWAVQSLGTSADLNHLYYVTVPVRGHGQQGTSAIPNYDPGDFDMHPNPANYTHSLAANASWADAVETRRQRALLLWGVEAMLFIVFVGIAAVRQKAKDPN